MICGNVLKKGGGKRGYEGGLIFILVWFRIIKIVLKIKFELILDLWLIVLVVKEV